MQTYGNKRKRFIELEKTLIPIGFVWNTKKAVSVSFYGRHDVIWKRSVATVFKELSKLFADGAIYRQKEQKKTSIATQKSLELFLKQGKFNSLFLSKQRRFKWTRKWYENRLFSLLFPVFKAHLLFVMSIIGYHHCFIQRQ